MIKILSVFGTRPEAIKMAPLVREISETEGLLGEVCVTAQHRDMLDQALGVFGIRPDYDLDIMRHGQTLSDITSAVILGLGSVIEAARPDILLVHGDTTTSFAAALAAFYHGVTVGHVEAGLRSYNRDSPYPEEMNRRLTGKLAQLHFAPTEQNVRNLIDERADGLIVQTGNTVIDALKMHVRDDYRFKNKRLAAYDFEDGKTILLTAHRRENLGKPLENIFNAVRRLSDEFPEIRFIYPVHKNPAVTIPAKRILGAIGSVLLIEPVDAAEMHNLMKRCYLVITDSGGLQEEAPALGKPVIVLRTETERPEAVEMGTVRIAGVETEDIVREVSRLLLSESEYEKMSRAVNPYGDGFASKRICAAIKEYFSGE